MTSSTRQRPDVIIVSDLHLCDGGEREDFLQDDEAAFADFVDELARHAPIELLINGDFIDFVQIQPRPQMWLNERLDASEPESLEKLEHVIAAHAATFDALARFIARSGQLRLHYGNHDVDLVWPAIQRRLRSRLGLAPDNDQLVRFGSDYLVGGVYVEHGQQADPPNSFASMSKLIHPDPWGMPRLERCWGTRFVEEFYNQIEELPGLSMLDNVRPRLHAATTIISHGLRHPQMYPVLRDGLKVIAQALMALRTDEDLRYAAEQVGLPIPALRLLIAAAGFFRIQLPADAGPPPRWAHPASDPAGAANTFAADLVGSGKDGVARAIDIRPEQKTPPGGLLAPALRRAYQLGQAYSNDPLGLERDLAELVGLPSGGRLSVDYREAVFNSPDSRRYIEHARKISQTHQGLHAVCFGHTHLATDHQVSVDGHVGWPIRGTRCRYFNSGSWTRSLNLAEPHWKDATFDDLRNPANYRAGRDFIHVRWTADRPSIGVYRWAGGIARR